MKSGYYGYCGRNGTKSIGNFSGKQTNPFLTASTRPSNIASSISPVHLRRAFLRTAGVAGVAGVAVTLLRLLREVDEGVESVDRREGVGRGDSIKGPKMRNRVKIDLSDDALIVIVVLFPLRV